MTVYSHSRLSCFEQCPQKFKLQYIDKVETEVEESVEAFLGSRTHETLEKFQSSSPKKGIRYPDKYFLFLTMSYKLCILISPFIKHQLLPY